MSSALHTALWLAVPIAITNTINDTVVVQTPQLSWLRVRTATARN
jgi:hypothetical protein